MDDKPSMFYQFVVLGAIIILNAYILVTTGVLDQTLTGALIGVMTGIGVEKASKSNNRL